MSLDLSDIRNIANLARLALSEEEIAQQHTELSKILDLLDQLEAVDTQSVEALAHPLDLPQRCREDQVTEADKHALFQAEAPTTEAGLYLVPKVIESAEGES